MLDSIAAISSGNINQPISIIRVEGPEAFTIVKKIFTGKIGKDKTITYGKIMDGQQMVDEVLVSWFKAPNTFSGNDIVEINAHGGVVVSNEILQLLLANGARIAERGEFMRRAFTNGKINLLKAEAIHDLIFAKTQEHTKLSVKKFDGKTSLLIESLKNKLLHIIATCETNIDYPEYDDVEKLTSDKLIPLLNEVQEDLNEIINASNSSRFIYEGISVAIVGKPNAGKSSLLNALLGEEKAIVTEMPGTTRDIVEGYLQIGQILFHFKDTAGIHTTNDKIEQLGIKKTLQEIKKADLIIHVVDPIVSIDEDDLQIEQASKFKTYIKVFSKSDLKLMEGISVSALYGDVTSLLEKIKNSYKDIDVNNEKIIYNTRQLALIKSSRIAIKDALSGLSNGLTPDVVIIDIQKAWEQLANILGRAEQSDLLDEIFKSFCLGK